MPDFELEEAARKRGFKFICGVDEAGRGPLAGPVCAAAVIFPEYCIIEGINDSKKLSEKKREELFKAITENAVSYCVAYGSLEEIEELNILETTFIAMKRAVDGLKIPADFAIIDGNRTPKNFEIPCQTVVKGDSKSLSVAAASILAKVSRDRLMLEYDERYPQYGFKKHKGYGTKEHIEKILEFGPSEIHRLSFLGKILGEQP